jgi:pimeloyl-ACP methyl ester carboxylesterase
MTVESLLIDVAGKKTQVQRGGQGPSVVFLHSSLGEADWAPWHDELASSFDVIVPAHPGFGDSEGLELIDDMEDMAFHYADLFAALDVKRPALIGQSLGGWIAAEYAVRWPADVSKLVLVDAAGLRVTEAPIADMWATRLPELADLMFADQTHPAATMMKLFQPDVPPPPEVLIPMFKVQQAAARVAWNPYLHNPKLEARLPRIACPTLIVWGAEDRFITDAHAERWVELIAGARLERLPGIGHLPLVERPEAVLGLLRDFLSNA